MEVRAYRFRDSDGVLHFRWMCSWIELVLH